MDGEVVKLWAVLCVEKFTLAHPLSKCPSFLASFLAHATDRVEIEAVLSQGCDSYFQANLCLNCSYIVKLVLKMDAQVDHLEKLLQSKVCAHKMTQPWGLAPC